MEVVYKRRRRGKRYDGSFRQFDSSTLLSEALWILGYRISASSEEGADVYQGSRRILKGASAKVIWGYLIRMHPRRFKPDERVIH